MMIPRQPQEQQQANTTSGAPASEVGKSNSLGRSTATSGRYPRKAGGSSAGGVMSVSRQSVKRSDGNGMSSPRGSFEEKRPVGVELVDAPMDD